MSSFHSALCQSFFLAGTDTGVGKTWVATQLLAGLARDHRVAGMKPVAAGAVLTSAGLRNDDAMLLAAAGHSRLPYEVINPYCFSEATSPHLAAAGDGICIDPAVIKASFDGIASGSDIVIVEGAGGWLAPIGPPARNGEPGPTMEDVAVALRLPVVLVVGLRLGCLNHALLTVAAIRRSGLPLLGWIANPVDSAFHDTERYVTSLGQRIAAPMLWRAPGRGTPDR